MTLNYYDLSNNVLRALNEVTFDSVAEFNSASGFHQHAKEAVNWAIARIYNEEDNEWSWQVTEDTQVLTIGTNSYSINSNAANVDWDSFYIDNIKGTEADFTSVTADNATSTFTIAAGSFITQGFAVGMKVTWSNLSESANNGVFTINTLTATVMTVDETVTDMTADTDFEVVNAASSPAARKLDLLNYDSYRRYYLAAAKNADTTNEYTVPTFITRNSENGFIVGPSKPDDTYAVKYDYFALYSPMSASTDTTTVPDRYEQIIIDGALVFCYEFRGDIDLRQITNKRFNDGIDRMRRNLIPIADTVTHLAY